MTSYLVLLNKIESNNYRQRELNFIIENSVKIAVCYVNNEFKKIKKIILKEDLETEDIALESVSMLFEKDTHGMFFRLIEAYKKWDPPVSTESDALFFLNKIISGSVSRHISRMLKNSDPVFSKIQDSVNYYARKNGYFRINYFGSVYISEYENFDVREKIISYKDFEKLPFHIFNGNKNILKDVFAFLNNETDYMPAIPLNALIIRLKNFYLNEYPDKTRNIQFNAKFESLDLIKKGLERASEKLESTYFKKGKLSKMEKTAFLSTLYLMAEDLSNGGLSPGLYNYLKIYIAGLTKSEYNSKYHNILEYLLKVMKAAIAQKTKA